MSKEVNEERAPRTITDVKEMLSKHSNGEIQRTIQNCITILQNDHVLADAGKAERKTVEQKKAMARKEKKPSIHERLEINKRIIQEKQGKDKPARGADLSVRTV